MANLSLWVLLFPLLGFIVLGLAGRFLQRSAVLAVAWGACGLAFLCALINFLSMLGTPVSGRVSDQVVFNWLASGTGDAPLLTINFGQYLDPLSMTMLLVVTGVGLLIHIYSAGYMEEDPGFWRFFAYLNFFIFAMVLLVSADNFLCLLVGWALVGLASFLLIGFWYQRRSAVAAARKAFVINVIGDFGLMLAIFLIFVNFQSLDFSNVLQIPNSVSTGTITAICLLLFVACAAKSAQLPLYMWLPDAMEGPTPVSALIHAATMVTAGVYLVARTHVLFDMAPVALNVVAGIGGATALFAATIALFQLDIKRVLAYSTISQLGYMFMAEGVQGYSAGIFHLVTHAFFKALLFLGAGAVIHALEGEQDMRKMGGLWSRMRITAWTFLIATLAISGIPPLAGFWSKDDILSTILAKAMKTGDPGLYVLWGIGLLTAGLTAFYMFRLFFAIFSGRYRGQAVVTAQEDEDEEQSAGHHHAGSVYYYNIEEVPFVMSIPLLILAILSVIGGFLGSLSLIGLAQFSPLPNFLNTVSFQGASMPEPSLATMWISTGLSIFFALLGFGLAWRLFYRKGFSGFINRNPESRNPLYRLVLNKYYVDEILSLILIKPILGFGRVIGKSFLEDGVLDGGSRGIAWLFRGISNGSRKVQTGYIRNYVLGILFGVVLIVVYYAVRG